MTKELKKELVEKRKKAGYHGMPCHKLIFRFMRKMLNDEIHKRRMKEIAGMAQIYSKEK